MAVLVEAISVIIRRDAIDSTYCGGWAAFERNVPNRTLCFDDDIVRVGFMNPDDARAYVDRLQQRGLRFLENGTAVDVAIADQQRGLTTQCAWLEFSRLQLNESGSVSACWFFDEPRVAFGVHLKEGSMTLATPAGWEFEGSLSHKFTFVPTRR